MSISKLRKESLGPFDNLALIRRYFAAVKSMDQKAVKGRDFDLSAILKLWNSDGELRIRGNAPIGEQHFKGTKELTSFYSKRAKGAADAFSVNLSKVNVANAKDQDHVVVSGIRYVVSSQGEGLQAPFTHNFTLKDGGIQSLDINVGTAGRTEFAPAGSLKLVDMGRLSAMAWMVA